MTYGKILDGHPHKLQILAVLDHKERDEFTSPRFTPNFMDRVKVEPTIDSYAFISNPVRGFLSMRVSQ